MTTHAEPGTPAMETLYAILEDGSLYMASWETGQPGTPSLPSPGRVVTEAEYRAELDAIQAANQARYDDWRAREEGARQGAYEALLAAGIPEMPARQISGYQGTGDPAA